MKVLLDECVTGRLARHIIGHEVSTVGNKGWHSIKNGNLLSLAVEAGFGAFVTVDKNLSFQNRIASYAIAVIVLRVPINNLSSLRPLVPQLLESLARPLPGTVTAIGS